MTEHNSQEDFFSERGGVGVVIRLPKKSLACDTRMDLRPFFLFFLISVTGDVDSVAGRNDALRVK